MKTCKVTFTNGTTMELPFRHFCGGTSVKLPRELADFRKQWVQLTYPRQGNLFWYIGRLEASAVQFPDDLKKGDKVEVFNNPCHLPQGIQGKVVGRILGTGGVVKVRFPGYPDTNICSSRLRKLSK